MLLRYQFLTCPGAKNRFITYDYQFRGISRALNPTILMIYEYDEEMALRVLCTCFGDLPGLGFKQSVKSTDSEAVLIRSNIFSHFPKYPANHVYTGIANLTCLALQAA